MIITPTNIKSIYLVQTLLAEVSFNSDNDHLICTGDIISKGPASAEVIDLLISMKASCVRGNHEDRILLTYQDLKSRGLLVPQPHQSHGGDEPPARDRDRDLASSLTPAQIQYLSSCPVILTLGPIPGMGETIVVHGGLVPGVELEKQDPVSVMNMRTLDLETRVPSRSAEGMAWNEVCLFLFSVALALALASPLPFSIFQISIIPPGPHPLGRFKRTKPPFFFPLSLSLFLIFTPSLFLFRKKKQKKTERTHTLTTPIPPGGGPFVLSQLWTKYQTYLPPANRTTVIYGHDSPRGLQLTKYAKGLDTGCVKGGRLTALVIKYDGSEPAVVSIKCNIDYRAEAKARTKAKAKKAGVGDGD